MLEAYEVIGMDECPPSTFEFNPDAYVLVDLARVSEGEALAPCAAWELIGADEIPPASYVPTFGRYREPVDECEAFAELDEAYEAGAESDAVFIARLHTLDIPACEARVHVAAWRAVHPDPWIWAHSYSFDNQAEMACREGA